MRVQGGSAVVQPGIVLDCAAVAELAVPAGDEPDDAALDHGPVPAVDRLELGIGGTHAMGTGQRVVFPQPAGTTEFGHLVPLSLGGAPNSAANLWPEPGGSPNPKDKLEGALRDLLCAHRITLGDAQQMIATNWVDAYRQIFGQNPPG